ncbi:MAG TPA: hypothetical protein VGH13_06065 [Xanthobacteraceae bacterium]|jgi:hypothetical protein
MAYLAPQLNASPENAPLRFSNQRVATTVVACVLAALAVGTRNLPTPSAPSTTAAHQDVAEVRIVDPAFCRDQTWPYIDQRCLKRAQPPQTASIQSASTQSASTQNDNASPPLNIAPQTPNVAPRDVAPSPPTAGQNSPSPIAAEAAVQNPQPVPADNIAAAPSPTDQAKVYSTTETAFTDDSIAVKPAPKPHHGRHHSRFFFGFRF